MKKIEREDVAAMSPDYAEILRKESHHDHEIIEDETTTTIMSMFNTDVICMDCKKEERNHPRYDEAVRADHEAIKSGNYNFEGIGYEKF